MARRYHYPLDIDGDGQFTRRITTVCCCCPAHEGCAAPGVTKPHGAGGSYGRHQSPSLRLLNGRSQL